MSPLKIHILLCIHCSPARLEDFMPANVVNSPSGKEAIYWMIGEELIEDAADRECLFRTTERGKAYVGALENLSLPVHAWMTF